MSTDYQTAIAYSHNFATAKPDILPTEKEHILGLCQTLESVGEDRDRFSRMFAQACETLGAVQEALGEESSTELTGFEPQLVKKTKEERDSLAAHVERISDYKNHLEAKGLMPARMAGVIEESPATSLARRDARVAADALDSCADELIECGHDAAAQVARSRARLSRHQAEGGDHA